MQSNLKSLQILRAIAATSVVYYHIALPPQANAIPKFGSFGVDIFFVISGFVMALVIANGQSPRTFAISRITRIVPLYWVLTTGVLILALTEPQFLRTTTANLGDGSYATYLSHFYVVEGMRKIVFPKLNLIDPYTLLGVLIIVSSSLAVGQTIYSLCDKPLSKYFRKRLLSTRQVREQV